jgi:hypothetical protein
MTDDPNAKPEYDAKAAKERGAKILERIKASEKRDDKWIKEAEAAEKAYANRTDETIEGKLYAFNILHSNVETIVPAIYNSTPVPDIRPRQVEATGPEPTPPPQQEGAPPDLVAMQQFQQMMQAYGLKKQRDKSAKEYGRLLERAIAVQIDDNRLDAEVEGAAQDGFLAGRGITRIRFEAETTETGVANERITFETVSWRDYREGPAARWDTVPWCAFRVPMDHETFERFADKEAVAAQDEVEPKYADDDGEEKGLTYVWEYWDKTARKVCFVREGDGAIIKESDDPLSLPGFFPHPQPIQPISLTGRRMPVCPFSIYKDLAEELDIVTKRITKVVKGLKVRGVVAGNASTLSKLSEADDNQIVVETELEQLVQSGGLDKAIAWWPVEQGVKVLQQLYAQRDQIKTAIYEITGISDIVRGASNAGETATAQQIKTQWGSLRIQKMQRLIERHVRDIFVMMAHLVSTKFSPETLSAMTGIQITPEVKALMQSPAEANYRVNVETNSTVRADLTQQKKEMGEFMAGTAQFFSSIGPIVEKQPMIAEPMAEIYSAATRMFRLGKQAEDALEQFVQMAKQAGKQPPPNPEAEKAKAEQARIAGEQQVKAQEVAARAGIDNRKIDLEERKLGIEESRFAHDQKTSARDHGVRMMESRLKQNEDGSFEPDTDKEQQLISAFMQGLQMLVQALQQNQLITMQGQKEIVKLISAPRQTQLVTGPDGKKTAISQPVTVN